MYGWLAEALEGGAQVVTANRRLATVLAEHYAQLQMSAGKSAWRSPAIRAWPDWLREVGSLAGVSRQLPARLNIHQSRVLWEQCLRQEVSSPLLNIGSVVRQARDAWALLQDYRVPLDDAERLARGRDQGIFARAARRYRAILDRQGWIDDAGLPRLVVDMIRSGDAAIPPRLVLAGFDRQTPAVVLVIDALREQGCQADLLAPHAQATIRSTACFDDPDAEMRAAGAWARHVLSEDPGKKVAIVAMQLEKDAGRAARLVREGLAPGWQQGGRAAQQAVNVSYGQRLANFPAVAAALLVLRWLHEDISSSDLSRLLRSESIGAGEHGARSRMELELRAWPGMQWSPKRALEVLNRDEAIGPNWRRGIEALDRLRHETGENLRPSGWATRFDETLQRVGWPGDSPQDSTEYQLHNRWRELLNELARLDLVIPSMSLREALGRLRILVGETIFQPENRAGLVQLLGPLEAAGMEFDHLWVCGLTNTHWPPPARPAALLSRELQREHSMPDAEPGDTLDYARRVLMRLSSSCSELVCSYALTEGDAEQRPSGLLPAAGPFEDCTVVDPGWYAAEIASSGRPVLTQTDPVPAVAEDESVSGGATTISYQLGDPFAAFAFGRLGIRPIPSIGSGLPPNVRGNIIHRALNALYHDRPSSQEIEGLLSGEFDNKLADIHRYAFAWLESRADPVLRQLLELEKVRLARLLCSVLELDLQRGGFEIGELELPVTLELGRVQLRMRIDRVDRTPGGELSIIDYKTGQRRRFLNADKEPADAQLVAYAMSVTEPVGELAYFNVDSRHVEFNGAGRELSPEIDWDESLGAWRDALRAAMRRFEAGDVRLNGALPAKDSRSFGLLARIRELQHDA
ncbi:MAG: PD-(D/E)XK nuclease family protein [Woeseiaceae bacterium]|nr:PD-(D/E)XK nuclease family protein [Woeseiaceae bacterium]